jgi:predicted dehydrogenase
MRIALIGCGYVADSYVRTLANHPEVAVAAVWDRDPARLRAFSSYWSLPAARSYDEVLSDRSVGLIVNLTNPRSHYEVSRAALQAGKHVYSEKPLATGLKDAEELVALAERRALLIASAPCSVLGETAQTLWKALREGLIGTPRLVYAELDDGPVPLFDYKGWRSDAGAPWPAKDEFEVGCTLEHAGYYLTWLTAFFGPARRITSWIHEVMPEKGVPLEVRAPDLAVAGIEFATGVVARFTCGLYAPHDHRLRVFGDAGVLSVDRSWDFAAPVRLGRRTRFALQAEKHPRLARWVGLGPRTLTPVRKAAFRWRGKRRGANRMDLARGVADLAAAARSGRPPYLSARWSLHVNELVLAMQDPRGLGSPREIRSTFDPIEPISWAR